jgi:hypothetical protein
VDLISFLDEHPNQFPKLECNLGGPRHGQHCFSHQLQFGLLYRGMRVLARFRNQNVPATARAHGHHRSDYQLQSGSRYHLLLVGVTGKFLLYFLGRRAMFRTEAEVVPRALAFR